MTPEEMANAWRAGLLASGRAVSETAYRHYLEYCRKWCPVIQALRSASFKMRHGRNPKEGER